MNRQEIELVRDLTRAVEQLNERIDAAGRMAYKVANGDVGAQLGGLSVDTVRGLIDRGELDATLAGRHLIVSRAALERFLDKPQRLRAAS